MRSSFRTVELNNPFYRLPAPGSFDRWRDAVPDDFLFAVKASRYITHIKRLRDVSESVALFLERAERLEHQARPHPLPASAYLPLPTSSVLRGFLDELPAGHRWVVEFRHPSWHTAEVYDTLARLRRRPVHPGRRARSSRPGDHGLLRLHPHARGGRPRRGIYPEAARVVGGTAPGPGQGGQGPLRLLQQRSRAVTPPATPVLCSTSWARCGEPKHERPPRRDPDGGRPARGRSRAYLPPAAACAWYSSSRRLAMSWCLSATCFSRSAWPRWASSTFRSSSRITPSCRSAPRSVRCRQAVALASPVGELQLQLQRLQRCLRQALPRPGGLLLRVVERDPPLQELLVPLGILLLRLEGGHFGFLLALLGQLALGVEGRDLLLLHLDHRLHLLLQALLVPHLGLGLTLVELGLIDLPLDAVGRARGQDLDEAQGAQGGRPAAGRRGGDRSSRRGGRRSRRSGLRWLPAPAPRRTRAQVGLRREHIPEWRCLGWPPPPRCPGRPRPRGGAARERRRPGR